LSGRRKRLDWLRLDYRRRVTTPQGKELVIRARREIDSETTDPLAVPLPWFIIVPWMAIREAKNHSEHEHRWVVDVYPRWESSKAKPVGAGTKAEALDLVDAETQRLRQGR
jgi:hypothetical protein